MTETVLSFCRELQKTLRQRNKNDALLSKTPHRAKPKAVSTLLLCLRRCKEPNQIFVKLCFCVNTLFRTANSEAFRGVLQAAQVKEIKIFFARLPRLGNTFVI
jgi:hypothetical protein